MKPFSDPDPTVSCVWRNADDHARSMLEARPCHADAAGATLFEPPVARIGAGLSWIAARGDNLERVALALGGGAAIGERIAHRDPDGFTMFVISAAASEIRLAISGPASVGAITLDSSLVRPPLADRVGRAGPAGAVSRAVAAALLFTAITDENRLDFGPFDALDSDEAMEMLLICAQIARRLGHHRADAAIQRQRIARQPSPHMRLQLARALVRAGDYAEAARAVDEVGAPLDQRDSEFLDGARDEVDSRARIAAELRRIAMPSRQSAHPVGRVAYCLHNALPYMGGGYAVRSHGLARALDAARRDIVAIVRPGFPSDSPAEAMAIEPRHRIEGVEYHFHNAFGRRGRLYGYLAEAADFFEDRFRALGIGLVHAATNYLTALPAGLAAHRLGLPFVYEVRSFWNLSREAKSFGAAETAEARRDDLLEQATLALADRVITLTDAMRDYLAGFGVTAADIDIAPNSVDLQRWAPRPRDAATMAEYGVGEGDIVIGYAGAMLGYEGLDMLVEAAAPIVAADPRVKLLIVGADNANIARPGTVEHGLAARMAGLGDRAMLASRVPHDRIAEVQALFDICAYPRLPLPVCELISPLKPLEAMAMGKAVVASSVGGMREMVRDGETGLVHAKGETAALSAALARLAGDAALRRGLGERARDFVRRERSWAQAARLVGESYEIAARRERPDTGPALRWALDALFTDLSITIG